VITAYASENTSTRRRSQRERDQDGDRERDRKAGGGDKEDKGKFHQGETWAQGKKGFLFEGKRSDARGRGEKKTCALQGRRVKVLLLQLKKGVEA